MKNEQQIKGQSKFKHKFTREFRQKWNFDIYLILSSSIQIFDEPFY